MTSRMMKAGLVLLSITTLIAVTALITLYLKLQTPRNIHQQQDEGNLVIQNQGAGRNKIIRRLNFTEDQIQQFDKIRSEYQLQTRWLRDSLDILKEIVLDELNREKPDTSCLTQYAHAMGSLDARIKSLTFIHFSVMKGLCNPEQEKSLNEIFHEAVFGPSSGFMQGQGKGKRYRWGNGHTLKE